MRGNVVLHVGLYYPSGLQVLARSRLKATSAKSSYHLETEEAERIAVDQVSHLLTWTRFHTCLISVDQVSVDQVSHLLDFGGPGFTLAEQRSRKEQAAAIGG